MEVQLNMKLQDLEPLRSEKESLFRSLREKTNELDHTKAEVEDLKDDLDRLQKTHSQCERIQKKLHTEVDVQKQKLTDYCNQNNEMQLKISDGSSLKARLENLETKHKNKCIEFNDLQADIIAFKEKDQLNSHKIQQLRTNLVREKSKLADLIGRLKALCMAGVFDKSIEAWEDDDDLIDHILKAYSTYKAAYEAACKETEALSQQRKMEIQEIKEFSRDIENLEMTRDQLQTSEKRKDSATLVKEVAVLEERLKMADSRELNLKNELKLLKKTIEDMRKDLVGYIIIFIN